MNIVNFAIDTGQVTLLKKLSVQQRAAQGKEIWSTAGNKRLIISDKTSSP